MITVSYLDNDAPKPLNQVTRTFSSETDYNDFCAKNNVTILFVERDDATALKHLYGEQ